MKKGLVVAFGIFAVTILCSPRLGAGQHTPDAQHSARVLHVASGDAAPTVEPDYESRSPERSNFGRLGPHRQTDLAIGSFGSNTAAAGPTVLVTYFNFNNPGAPNFASPPGSQPTFITSTGTA